MKNILYTIILSFLLLSCDITVTTTDFQAGMEAYKAGDYATALKEWKPSAELGDAYAQYSLGFMYKDGQGVTQDYKEAAKWFRLAAEQGIVGAQFNLARLYSKGQGVTQDYILAHMWFNAAARRGYKDAYKNMDTTEDKMTSKQITIAQKLVSKCAQKNYKDCSLLGDAYVQYSLGFMYKDGQGVTQDYKEAAKRFRLAAEQGIVDAQFNLARLYSKGQGVTQDYKEAAKWFRLAAEQGIVGAQFDLARLYSKGQGVTQDYILAHMWFNVAARDGHENAKANRDITERYMTDEQLVEAQKLARECIKKNYKDCG